MYQPTGYWEAYRYYAPKSYRGYITEPKPYHSVRELEMDRISKDRHLQQFFGRKSKAAKQRKERTWVMPSEPVKAPPAEKKSSTSNERMASAPSKGLPSAMVDIKPAKNFEPEPVKTKILGTDRDSTSSYADLDKKVQINVSQR